LKLNKILIEIVLAFFSTPVHPGSGAVRAVRTDVIRLVTDHARLLMNVPSRLFFTHPTRALPRIVTRIAFAPSSRRHLALACRLLGCWLSEAPFLLQPCLNGRPLKGTVGNQVSQRSPALSRGSNTCKFPKVNLQTRLELLNLDLLISDLT
jgi:hypothetical protein